MSKAIKIIFLNILILITIIGSLVFLLVIFSETTRYVKSKFYYKNEDCIRASCIKAYENYPWAKKHFKEYSEIKFHYETPVVWRADEFSGDTINISKNSYTRVTISEKKNINENKKVYFFGGSVVWGFGSNDINTIPSHFQDISGYRTVNFGESAWTSDQSLFYLIKLIKKDHRPDYVIFINGVNDVMKCSSRYGAEDGLLKEDELNIKFSETIRSKSKTTFKNFFSIPIEIFDRIKSNFVTKQMKSTSVRYSKCLKSDFHKKIAKNVFENWKIANKLVSDYGGEFVAILEPQLIFTDTRIDTKIGFNKNNVYNEETKKIYSEILKLSQNVDYVHDFKSIYNGIDDYIFIDIGHHVSPKGNKFLANKIFTEIIE